MKLEVLGTGCAKCNQLMSNVQQAVTELELDASVEKVSDLNRITGYGVMMIPALVVDGEVKLSGKAASVEAIKKILQG